MKSIHISRPERIRMFLNEYYFGYNSAFIFLRLLLGPVLIALGIYKYGQNTVDFWRSLGGFAVMYGIYHMLKPFLWVLIRFNSFKGTDSDIMVKESGLHFKEEEGESEVNFAAFKEIRESKRYYTFLLSEKQKIFLPKRALTIDEQRIIERQLK